MNISSTAASASLTSLLNVNQAALAHPTDGADSGTASGTQAAGGHHHHHGGAKALFDALEQTLNQLGLNSQAAAASTNATTTAGSTSASSTSSAATAATDSSATHDVGTAVRAFMHALFQAAQADGSGGMVSQTTAVTATGGQAYGDMSSKLQDVLQNLAGGATGGSVAASASSTGSSADASLDTAFQNLLQSLGSSTATNGDSSTLPVSLQSFAQDLLQNLRTGASNPFENAGSLTSTTV